MPCVHFIVNPASGRPAPVLYHINRACAQRKLDWEISVTKPGGTQDAARRAVDGGAERIIVYGGDGSIADVAGALIDTKVPLGIIPGGTANVLSAELGIPRDIPAALEIGLDEHAAIRRIDVGRINGKIFLLRVGFGLEAEIMRRADRESKNLFGWLAYAFSGLSALVNTRQTDYEFTVDGHDLRRQGLGLIVANSANVGMPGLSIVANVAIDDGELDVILIRAADIRQILARQEEGPAPESIEMLGLFERWSGKEIKIHCRPRQPIQYDGELLEDTAAELTVIPRALHLLVPQ